MFSLPAVALAAGKLMKLDVAKLTEAVNLAINDHISTGQTRRQVLSDWKGLSDGEASRNAVFAAMLARGGLTGPTPIFEGTLGVFKHVSGEANIDVAKFGGHGNPFRINQCGMKSYPAVVFTQTAIVAAMAIADEVTKGAPTRPRRSNESPPSKSPRPSADWCRPAPIARNGRPRRAKPPIIPCPTSQRAPCLTATSPMTATRRRS